jgi:high frequency lysogenization protein
VTSLADQTIALAGVFQTASLVEGIATRGMADAEAVQASIESLFRIDAESVEAVYGGIAGVRLGLREMRGQILAAQSRATDQTRYVIALLQLERKLSRRRDLSAKIREGIEQAREQTAHFSMTHRNVLASLADTYRKTISTLRPRIMVNGAHVHLSNADNANRIRALLLAGIRSGVLWRQVGGRWWHVLFRRKPLGAEAARLLLEPDPD